MEKNRLDKLPAIVFEWADKANALIVPAVDKYGNYTDRWDIDSPFCDMPEDMTTEELVFFCAKELEEIIKQELLAFVFANKEA